MPAASSRRGLRTVGTRRSSSSIAATTSAATPMTATTMRASSSTSTGRTSSTPTREADPRLPVAVHRVAPLRAPRAGVGRRQARADPDQSRHGQHALRAEPDLRANSRTGLHARAEPVDEIRTSEDVVVVGRRPRTLRKVLSRLHPQAMGPRPVRARQVGDRRACRRGPIATTATSPTNYQFMPKHGYTRMFERMLDHPNIHVMTQNRLSATSSDVVPHRRADLHRPDRRVFRFPVRQAALSLAALRARHARSRSGTSPSPS